ncbi:hypothetical protein H6776_00165 [Candidatus Nomurabacteria bacterium]|nr:hypothetical protein [Candidatus Nomurabacteria bacterium]
MNRKWFGVILITLGILLIGLFIFLFFINPNRESRPDGSSLPEVPFGPGAVGEPGTTTGTGSGQGGTGTGTTGVPAPEEKRQLLFQITDFPITGYAPYVYQKEEITPVTRFVDIENEDGTTTTEEITEDIITTVDLPRVRYHDQSGGLIYDTIIDRGLERQQLIDNPINGMYESSFAGQDRIYMRYFDNDEFTIKTYRGRLTSSMAQAYCPYDFTLPHEEGDTGRDIETIQSILTQVIVPPQPLTPATFDGAMTLAVKAFQEARGIKVDALIKGQTNGELQKACLEIEQRKLEREIAQSDEAPYSFSGTFIEDDIVQLAVHPEETDIFRLVDRGDTAWGIVSDPAGNGAERIYDFDFRDWIVEWAAPEVISFTTKASGRVPGYVYLYDLTQKDLFNVLKGYHGLTSKTSTDGSRVLYAYSVGQTGNQFGVMNVSDRTMRPLAVQTLPEKCVWSKDNINVYCMVPQRFTSALYPDEWYQRGVSFTDTLWRINTDTGMTAIIETFSSVPYDPDGVRLQLNDDESFVFIIDQKTGFLWARDLVHSENDV